MKNSVNRRRSRLVFPFNPRTVAINVREVLVALFFGFQEEA
jgi:hypothetical protein